MAEIEIGVMVRPCLDQRIPDQESLKREIEAWQNERNKKGVCGLAFHNSGCEGVVKSLYPAI